MTVESTAAVAEARARGVARRWVARRGSPSSSWRCSSGSASGRSRSAPGAILESALSHVPFLDVHCRSSARTAIVWQLRAPRVVLGALVGGMLAIAGAAYQGVFRNPLADPYLLGVAAGAGLARRSRSRTPAARARLCRSAAFVGRSRRGRLAYALGRSVGGGACTASLVLAGVPSRPS